MEVYPDRLMMMLTGHREPLTKDPGEPAPALRSQTAMTSRSAAGAAARPREPRFFDGLLGAAVPHRAGRLRDAALPLPSPVPMIAAPGQAVSAFPEASAFPPRSRIWSPTVEEAVQRALACNSQPPGIAGRRVGGRTAQASGRRSRGSGTQVRLGAEQRR